MDDEIVRRLVDLNAQFYDQLADPFAASRAAPQPGYERLPGHLPPVETPAVLDVGCGNGRFGRFLLGHGRAINYTGVDFSERLMATSDVPGGRYRRDLSRPDALAGLPDYDLIACLSTLQHIPGRVHRERLLREMADHLRPSGGLILANWQFLDSPRQRRKLRPWSDAGLREEQVEPGDYLLSWDRGGTGLRYVALIDEAATSALAAVAGLRLIEQFRSDGREGDLNLYSVMVRSGSLPRNPGNATINPVSSDNMDLKEQLRADVTAAMRSGDARRRDILRMVIAAIKQTEIDSRQELDDAGVQDVLRKQIKQRQESIADFTKAGRQQDVERESAEIDLIQTYLPQMMSREEVERLARMVIDELGIADAKGTGQVMSRLMPQVKGKADGRLVNEVVRDLLN